MDEASGHPPNAAFRIETGPESGGRRVVRLGGPLELARAEEIADELRRIAGLADTPLRVDLSGADSIDGATAAVLLKLARDTPFALDATGASTRVTALLDLHRARPDAALHEPPRRISVFEQAGRATLDILGNIAAAFAFIGQLAQSSVAALRTPSSVHWRDVGRLIERMGADGVPIVVLIAFLVGLTTAFQAGIQAKQYGANVFVPVAVAIGICREMGPLMAAIVVTGRTGAGIAAELGTMKVSEEIDALRTLGLDPLRHLVLPRVIALVVALPILTLLADAVGIAGGLLVGVTDLELSTTAYLNITRDSLSFWHVATGIIKSYVFALVISLVACHHGLSTRGGAEGVGRSTTAAVVVILVHIVVVDMLFTVIFELYGV